MECLMNIESFGNLYISGNRVAKLLQNAITQNQNDAVIELVSKNKNLLTETQAPDGNPWLYSAIKVAKCDIVNTMIEYGADPTAKDAKGFPLLQHAINIDNFEVIKLMLEKGADPTAIDAAGDPLLDFAIQKNSPEVIKLMLVEGARAEGIPLLLYALVKGNQHIIQCIKEGAQFPKWSDTCNGSSPLRYLVNKCPLNSQFEIIKPFIQDEIKAQIEAKGVVVALNSLCDDECCWYFLSKDETFF